MHGQGTIESKLRRLRLQELEALARRNGIATAPRKSRQRTSAELIREQLMSLVRTGRDLGLD